MSWLVEQSDSASDISVNGNTVICNRSGSHGSPVNILYQDAADANGSYYWQVHFEGFDKDRQSSGASVGLTTQEGFKAGWGLKAMNYLGNLSDGSGLLVGSFGDQIKEGDTVGLLLILTDAEMKFYLIHNDRPMGLAFHVQAPYPRPLFPVVSFDTKGTATITRSQQIPSALDRTAQQFTGFDGNWKITEYQPNPECIGLSIALKRNEEGNDVYSISTGVVNSMWGQLTRDPSSDTWQSGGLASTRMGGPPEAMAKERILSGLIGSIQKMEVQGDRQLVIKLRDSSEVKLERYEVPAPKGVTKNIFSKE